MVTLGRPVLSSCEIHGIFAGEDWPPDADGPDIAQKQLSGVDVAGKTFKVHLDGADQRDHCEILREITPGQFSAHAAKEKRQ